MKQLSFKRKKVDLEMLLLLPPKKVVNELRKIMYKKAGWKNGPPDHWSGMKIRAIIEGILRKEIK
jgi:hypothetical protein